MRVDFPRFYDCPPTVGVLSIGAAQQCLFPYQMCENKVVSAFAPYFWRHMAGSSDLQDVDVSTALVSPAQGQPVMNVGDEHAP